MPSRNPEPVERINVLLPFGDDSTRRLTEYGSRDEWAANEYRQARAAAAEIEQSDYVPAEPDIDLMQRVLQAVVDGDAGRGEIAMATTGGQAQCVMLSELGDVGPSPSAAFCIPEIGVVSVPARADVPTATKAVKDSVQRLHGEFGVEPAVTYYTVALLTQEERIEVDVLGEPAENIETEGDDIWFEAALSVDALAETLPWGVRRVNAPPAWARGYLGQGVRVAIVDTGVGPHVDLPAPVASATFVPGTTSANDDNGHGTHVAGTALARRNGRGVIGVAPRASLMRAKVLNRLGSGSDVQVAAGIVWAVNQGARIINLSLGSPFPSAVIDRAVAYARLRRVVVCAAAGNDGCNRPVIHPARNPFCIAVAATDQLNHKASFSNCGSELDLAAPGVSILSSYPANAYRALNGTSMATPHVAGSAALVLNKRPGLTPAQVQAILERTAIPLGPTTRFGHGLVQADRAVGAAIASVADSDGVPLAIGGEQLLSVKVAPTQASGSKKVR